MIKPISNDKYIFQLLHDTHLAKVFVTAINWLEYVKEAPFKTDWGAEQEGRTAENIIDDIYFTLFAMQKSSLTICKNKQQILVKKRIVEENESTIILKEIYIFGWV